MIANLCKKWHLKKKISYYLFHFSNPGKVVITADVDIGDNLGRDGEKHWSIKTWKHTYDVKEKSTIELENLFNGNQVLGEYLPF